jgi:hypothetical protein
MFGDRWLISVAMRFGATGLQGINNQVKGLNAGIAKAEAAALRFRNLGTSVAGVFALMGGAIIGYGVMSAAKFQLAMQSVGLTVNATKGQLEDLSNMAMHMADVTAQSGVTIAQEMTTAAQGGLGSYSRLKALFPALAQFADVEYFQAKAKGRDFQPTEAISYGVQFAHMFQAYDATKMKNMLEWMVKLTNVTSESPQRAITQAKYFIPLGHALGMNTEQAFTILAMMGQTGFLRGKGGTSIENTLLGAIGAATLTGHSQAKQREGLGALGILSGGRNTLLTGGRLDWGKLNTLLASDATHMKPVDFVNALKSGLGKQATQFDAVLYQPDVQKQMRFIQEQFKQMDVLGKPFGGVLERFFAVFQNQDFIVALQRFITNLQTLDMVLFKNSLPLFTRELVDWSNHLTNMIDYLNTHKDAAVYWENLIIHITEFMAARFALGKLVEFFGVLAGVSKIGPGLTMTTKAFMALDNFAFMGLAQKLLSTRAAIASLLIAERAAGGLLALASGISSIANALGPLMAIIPINMRQQSDATGAYNWMAQHYGAAYANKLKASHAYGSEWPWNYDKGTFPPGAPLPGKHLGPFGGPPHVTHVSMNVQLAPGTTQEQAKQIVALASGDMRSTMKSHGSTMTSPKAPPLDNYGLLFPAFG